MRRSIYPKDITTEVQNLNRTSLRTYSRLKSSSPW